MYAYISYVELPGKRAIVDTKMIRHFNVEEDVRQYKKRKYYLKDGNETFAIQVLFVHDKRELVENMIKSKRISVTPKSQLETCDEETDTSITATNTRRVQSKAPATSTQTSSTQKYLQERAKSRAVEDILELAKNSQTQSQVPVTYGMFSKPLEKGGSVKHAGAELAAAEQQISKLKKLLSQSREESIILKTQNADLQQKVIDRMDELAKQFERAKQSTPIMQEQDTGIPILGERDGKTHLGHDVWLPTDQMDLVQQASTRPALFVRNLATQLWGDETLKLRSVCGKKGPKSKDGPAKVRLTPRKINAVRGALKVHMTKQGKRPSEIDKACVKVPQFLNAKIGDLNRTPLSPNTRKMKRAAAIPRRRRGLSQDAQIRISASESDSSIVPDSMADSDETL